MGCCSSKNKKKDKNKTSTPIERVDTASGEKIEGHLSEKAMQKKHNKAINHTYMNATRMNVKLDIQKRMKENSQKPTATDFGDNMFGKYDSKDYEGDK